MGAGGPGAVLRRALPGQPARAGAYILSPLRGWAGVVLALVLLFAPSFARAEAPAPSAAAQPSPATLPAAPPAGIDAALWAKMKAIDQTAGKIEDLTADFE